MGLANFPPAGKVSAAAITSVSDSTQQNPLSIFGYVDSSGRWSVVKYYQSAASIRQGAVLQHALGSAAYVLREAVLAQTEAGDTCRGIAAAAVSNTGYYSFAFVAGYCPAIFFPSTHDTNVPYRMATGGAGSGYLQAMLNATYGSSTSPKNPLAVAIALASAADSGTIVDAGLIFGWLM